MESKSLKYWTNENQWMNLPNEISKITAFFHRKFKKNILKIWTDPKNSRWKKPVFANFWKISHFSANDYYAFFHDTRFCCDFLVISAIIFHFCRIQSILVKNAFFVKLGRFWLFLSNSTDFSHKRLFLPFFAHVCKIRPISNYLIDFCQIPSFSENKGQFFWAGNVLLKT